MSKIIAITGGIGSGKSYVLELIKKAGYKTFSCDDYTVKAYQSKEVRESLVNNFNTCEYEKIKELAFLNNNIKILSSIITPKVMELTILDAKKEEGMVFVEVPILFEMNYQNLFDKVFIIKRDLESRINSVIKRSNLTREQVLERIKSQVDYEKLDTKKYIVIENNEKLKENLSIALDNL